MLNRKGSSCGGTPSNTILQHLSTALHRIEQAWFTSAEKTRCFQIDTLEQQDREGVSRMKPVRLNSGHAMPPLGLGVYQSPPGEETYKAVLSALRIGYRHIDTAQFYGNEADVGRAVADSGIPRGEVFITTKLWRADWGYEKAKAAVAASLQRLGTPYLDLMLLHQPGDPGTRADTWRALEDCASEGLIRSIGVSNFGIGHLEKLAASSKVTPAVNQIELSPFLQRPELVEHCRRRGIVVEAYSPLCKAQKLAHPTVVALAAKLGVSPAQLLIRWSLQKGFVPLPKSTNPERQRENFAVFNFCIPDAEMSELDGLDEHLVTGWDPVESDPV